MPSIKKFFSLDYYASLLSGRSRFRLSLVTFLLSLILTIRPSVLIYKDFLPLIKDLENKIYLIVDEVFPAELEIKIENGYASTNVTEPYYLTVSGKTFENFSPTKNRRPTSTSKFRILAIDTKGKAEDFERYQSLALLTETSLVYYNDEKINITSLREVKNFTLNKELIKKTIGEINQNNRVGKIINLLTLALPLFILLGIFSGLLMSFLFPSILVWLLAKILQVKTPFKAAYGYSAAVLIILSCLEELLSLLPYLKIGAGFLPIFSNLILLAIAYPSLNQIKNQMATAPPVANLPSSPIVSPPTVSQPIINPPPTSPLPTNPPATNLPIINPPSVDPNPDK